MIEWLKNNWNYPAKQLGWFYEFPLVYNWLKHHWVLLPGIIFIIIGLAHTTHPFGRMPYFSNKSLILVGMGILLLCIGIVINIYYLN